MSRGNKKEQAMGLLKEEDPLPLAGATISRWGLSKNYRLLLDWRRRMVVVPARDRGSAF
jgi:hypothetical protein